MSEFENRLQTSVVVVVVAAVGYNKKGLGRRCTQNRCQWPTIVPTGQTREYLRLSDAVVDIVVVAAAAVAERDFELGKEHEEVDVGFVVVVVEY